MKISKVDHTSTGIGVSNKKSEGMLYKNPSKYGIDARYDVEGLEERVKALNEKAQRLYNVFNEIKDDDKEKSKEEKKKSKEEEEKNSTWKKIKYNFSTFIRGLVEKNPKDRISFIRNLQNETFEIRVKGVNKCINGRYLSLVPALQANTGLKTGSYCCPYEALIKEYANASIRRAYNKSVKSKNGKDINVREVVIKLVKAVADQNIFTDVMSETSDDELNAFLEILEKDYSKEKQIERIIDSIKKQDTRVQTINVDGQVRLIPAFGNNPKKKALFDFMIAYSEGDEKIRGEMLSAKKSFIWTYLSSGNSDGTVFSEKLEDTLGKLAAVRYKKDIDKAEKKAETKDLYLSIDKMLNNELVAKYQDMSDSFEEDDEQSVYWLKFFGNETDNWIRTQIKKRNGLSFSDETRRLTIKDLYDHLFNYFLSFIAAKYIDMGKGVYHFTNFESDTVGKVLDEFKDGISSFDYERIAAEERVKRDMSTYVAFAVNDYATSVCTAEVLKSKDDALEIDPKANPEKIRKNAKKRILRYFGGESAWDCLSNVSTEDFVSEFRESLGAIRNSTVHFDTAYKEGRTENSQEIIKKMFNEEYGRVGMIFAKKYYSNNLPMFYKVEDICNLVGKSLYTKDRPIVAAVPAFSRIMKETEKGAFINEWIGKDKVYKIKDLNNDMLQKLESAIYFTLKEIYYYGFLGDEHMLSYMNKALITIEPPFTQNQKAKTEINAYNNFKKRYDEIKNSGHVSASEICERIMMDFALQNNDIKEVKTSKNASKFDEEIYEHYRMILYKQIRVAFLNYLDSKAAYAFLKKPENRVDYLNKLTVEEFASKIKINAYSSVKGSINDTKLLSWYAIAHFMNKKQINLLCGAIRTEIRYLKDIDRRAESTRNSIGKETARKLKEYEGILRVLEFTMNFVDVSSNNIFDYYDSEEEYAKKLHAFVDFPVVGDYKTSLISFCNTEMPGSKNGKIGIYYDAENPIAGKNIIRADMFGNENLFESGIVDKVNLDDIGKYYSTLSKTEEIFFANNTEKTEDEQKTVRKFQNLKNRVEFTNVVTYSEIINELYGQLLSWVYLRERDLIYMQLGFHYVRLFWGNTVSNEDILNKYIEDGKFNIQKGAILYFIKAMYSHDMVMPKKIKVKDSGSDGVKVNAFAKYFGEPAYNAGLELFETSDVAHVETICMRNYIAHFKYFSQLDHSMEELYGDVFSQFFTYSVNYHKSIPVVYKNILAQYKLIADIEIEESESKPYSDKQRAFKNAKWVIKPDYEKKTKRGMQKVRGLDADKLTFKTNGDKRTVKLPAHDAVFVDNVRKMLTYKK